MVEFLAAECAYSIVLEVLVQLVSPLGADGKMQTPFITTCLAFVLSAGQRACTEAGLHQKTWALVGPYVQDLLTPSSLQSVMHPGELQCTPQN